MKDTDLFVAERLIERTQTQAANGFAFRLGNRICAQDEKTPAAGADRRTCLKLRGHGQILCVPNGAVSR